MADQAERELLALAAKAAGKHAVEWVEPGAINAKGGFVQFIGFGQVATWNPRDDDGDALRLAGLLGMNLVISDELGVTDARVPSKTGWCTEHHWDTTGAATRRAIWRTAAEIGRTMQ